MLEFNNPKSNHSEKQVGAGLFLYKDCKEIQLNDTKNLTDGYPKN